MTFDFPLLPVSFRGNDTLFDIEPLREIYKFLTNEFGSRVYLHLRRGTRPTNPVLIKKVNQIFCIFGW